MSLLPHHIRHHQQDHAQIWVTPLDGDKIHVAVSNCGASTAIILDAEICAELFEQSVHKVPADIGAYVGFLHIGAITLLDINKPLTEQAQQKYLQPCRKRGCHV